MDKNAILALVRQEIERNKRDSQYGVSRVPTHSHNGMDSPKISISGGAVDRPLFASSHVPGTTAASAANYGHFYIHPEGVPPATVITLMEVHGREGNDPSDVLMRVALLDVGDASLTGGVGITTFDLKGTANSPVFSTLVHGKPAAVISPGQRLALQTNGTLTNVADVCVTVFLQY